MADHDDRLAALEHALRERDAVIAQLRAELRAAGCRDQARGLLATLLDHSPIGFALHDRELRCIHINAALAAINGIPVDDHADRRLANLLPAISDASEQRMRHVLDTGQALVNVEESGVTRAGDGERHWLTSYYPARQTDGEIAGVGVFVVDVTERVRMEEALRLSEAHYRSFVERLPLVVYQADLADVNRGTYVSPQIETLLGYTPEEWCADPTFWVSRVHPADQEWLRAVQAQFQATGVPLPTEHRMIARDGRVVWVHDEAVIVADETGAPAFIQGFTQDVTARKAAEAQRDLLAAIVEVSHVSIVAADLDGTVLSWNAGAERIYGLTDAEMVGRPLRRIVPADRFEELQAISAALHRGEMIDQLDTVRLRRDGAPFPVSLSASPLRDHDGRITGAAFVVQDSTERKALEQKMQETQRLESLGVLAGGIAHDFNNLLAVIIGNAELAQADAPADSPLHESLTPLLLAARRAAELTRQMLAYAGRGSLRTALLDLNGLIAGLVPLLRAALPRTVTLITQLAPELAPVWGDDTQLQQVVMNLVINGGEAIDSAAGTVTITTTERVVPAESLADYRFGSEQPAGRYVQLTVADSGSGMEPATRERIFDPFFSTKFAGRGLGLAAVLGIVRAHHGALRVDSLPGRGTTFTLLLPVAPEQPAAPAEPPAPPSTNVTGPTPAQRRARRGRGGPAGAAGRPHGEHNEGAPRREWHSLRVDDDGAGARRT
jgi:PAS domain S-box-containing protein